MKIDGVFEGGGIKGIAFVGAICCMEDNGYTWERLAGSSAGAIIASLLAVGYSGLEIKNIMMNSDYGKIIAKEKGVNIPGISKGIRLFREYGMHTGEFIDNWLKSLFETKGKTKFRDLYVGGQSKLKIIASDVTRKEMIVLPDDLVKYGIEPQEFEIWKAVRMSISIPFYFSPVRLQYNNSFSFIVDGGLLSNFPVWIFDVKGIPRWPTFGFKLVEESYNYNKNSDNIITFIRNLIETVINRNEDVFIRDRDKVRIISIPVRDVKTTDFDISKEKMEQLFDSGFNSAGEFLNSWNFPEYVRKYRRS